MGDPSPENPAGRHVFVSYASAELDRVRALVAAIERAGV